VINREEGTEFDRGPLAQTELSPGSFAGRVACAPGNLPSDSGRADGTSQTGSPSSPLMVIYRPNI